MVTMYPAANSQVVQLAANVSADATEIPVSDIAAFPPAPNVATIGMENDAEVILYNAIDAGANQLTGVVRSRSGTLARVWQAGENIYHSWTAENANAIMDNIRETIADLETKANLDGADFSGPVTITQRPVVTAAEILTADRTVYVAKTGNDGTGDGSEGNPFLTIQRAVDYCYGLFGPQYAVTISVGNGLYPEDVLIRNMTINKLTLTSTSQSSTAVIIQGQTTASDISKGGAMRIESNMSTALSFLTINGASGQPAVSVNGNPDFEIRDFVIGGNLPVTPTSAGITAFSANVFVSRGVISNGYFGINSALSSNIHYRAMNAAGAGNTIGCRADGGFIIRSGTQIQGATAEIKANAGQIFA